MKIPKTLKIGAHSYKVLFPYRFTERADCVGMHIKATTELKITDCDDTGNKRALSDIYVSLIHEILHAIDYRFAHGIIAKNEIGEDIITALAEGLTAFLIDNGYLKKEVK